MLDYPVWECSRETQIAPLTAFKDCFVLERRVMKTLFIQDPAHGIDIRFWILLDPDDCRIMGVVSASIFQCKLDIVTVPYQIVQFLSVYRPYPFRHDA